MAGKSDVRMIVVNSRSSEWKKGAEGQQSFSALAAKNPLQHPPPFPPWLGDPTYFIPPRQVHNAISSALIPRGREGFQGVVCRYWSMLHLFVRNGGARASREFDAGGGLA